jgi:hypothetical protein
MRLIGVLARRQNQQIHRCGELAVSVILLTVNDLQRITQSPNLPWRSDGDPMSISQLWASFFKAPVHCASSLKPMGAWAPGVLSLPC